MKFLMLLVVVFVSVLLVFLGFSLISGTGTASIKIWGAEIETTSIALAVLFLGIVYPLLMARILFLNPTKGSIKGEYGGAKGEANLETEKPDEVGREVRKTIEMVGKQTRETIAGRLPF